MLRHTFFFVGFFGGQGGGGISWKQGFARRTLKVPTCSVSQLNAFMYVQNVSSLLIEMQYISAENFNIDK